MQLNWHECVYHSWKKNFWVEVHSWILTCLNKNVFFFILKVNEFIIKTYETLRIHLECLKLFHLKSHCFFHVSFANGCWKWRDDVTLDHHLPGGSLGLPGSEFSGHSLEKTVEGTKLWNRIPQERCKNAIQIYTDIFGQHMCVLYT